MDKFTDSVEFNKAVSPKVKELWGQMWDSLDKIQQSEKLSQEQFKKEMLTASGMVTIRR